MFEKKFFDQSEVLLALRNDYESNEVMRQIFLNKTPKYGNDDDYADEIAKEIVDVCVEVIEELPSHSDEKGFPEGTLPPHNRSRVLWQGDRCDSRWKEVGRASL